LVSDATRPRDPARDLNSEVFSAMPDAEPSEVLKYMERPLKKELARLRESDKDLKNELFSKTVEAEPNEAFKPLARPLVSELTTPNAPVRVLKIESCSPTADPSPSESVKDLARPLVSEVARDNEPVNDLKSEVRSVIPGLVVHKSLRVLKRDIFSAKLEIEDSDPPIDLKMEVFSDNVAVEPIDADKYIACPLRNELAKPSESVNVLK
jgi:hypothetical protein